MRKSLILAAALLWPAVAGAGSQGVFTLLDCNFNDKTIGQLIGIGGPGVGEPIDRGLVPATVRSQPFSTPSLEMTDNWGIGARQVRFEFLDGATVSTGNLDFSFKLNFQALNSFNIYLREKSFSAVSFLDMTFTSDGSILVSDLNSGNAFVGSYTPGTTMRLLLSLDLTAQTYTFLVNDAPLILNGSLGQIPQGIGAILIGLDHDEDSAGTFFLDDLLVTASESPQPVEGTTWSRVKMVLR